MPPRPVVDPGPDSGERVPLDLKLAFGAPTFASAALVLPMLIHLPKFYADQALVPLGLLAIAVAVGRAFDAITDPLVGWLSDRTRSRWGRRRPYLALGPPFCAVSLVLLFTPPAALGGADAALWFCATYVLYHLFHTLYLVPHLALGAEISLDYHERSTLFAFREAFMVLGTFSAALAPLLLGRLLGSERAALSAFAVIFGVLLVASYAWLTLRVRERPEFQKAAPNPLIPGIRRSLRNRTFRLLLLTSILASVPAALAATLMRFYLEEVMRPERPTVWLAVLLGSYFGAAALSLPVWVRAAHRFGKKPAWLASFVCCGGGILPLLVLGPGDVVWMLGFIACAGIGFGAISVLSLAIKADVIDYDQLLTGKRREAQFGAFWSFLPKFVAIPGAAIPIAVLGTLGYAPNQPQSAEVVWTIKAMMALVPALLFGAAFWFGRRLLLDESRHRRIREGIAAHARGAPAFDPIEARWVEAPTSRSLPDETAWFLDHFSPAELEHWQRYGAGRVLQDVVFRSVLFGVASIAAFSAIVPLLTGFDAKPGAGAVVLGSVGGLAGCVAVFHLLRIRPAFRLRRDPPPREHVAEHLRELARDASARASIRAPGAAPNPPASQA